MLINGQIHRNDKKYADGKKITPPDRKGLFQKILFLNSIVQTQQSDCAQSFVQTGLRSYGVR